MWTRDRPCRARTLRDPPGPRSPERRPGRLPRSANSSEFEAARGHRKDVAFFFDEVVLRHGVESPDQPQRFGLVAAGEMPGRKLRRFEEYLAVVRVGANRGRQCVQAGLDRAVLAQQPLSQWSRSVTNSVTASRARW